MAKYATCKLTYDNYPIEILVKLTDNFELKIYDDVDDEWCNMDSEELSVNLLSKSNDHNHVLAVTAIFDMLTNNFNYDRVTGSKALPNYIDLDSDE